ncbi:MAG: cysteine desulfurase family protein [Candidatus Thorarchaeota archaeon]|nr:cysteine desulfurase family protein [Candidatus Thorarchaeota archaeon]
MEKQIYLDYQSAKPVDPRVVEAMLPYFTEKFGNASALHKVGDIATDALEESRAKIAELINADSDEILFTSGATEASNLAIIGYAMKNKNKGKHVVISEVDHISIHNIAKYLTQQGFEVSKVPVDQYGRIKLGKLERRLRDDTILVSIGYASNEIGTIQPIKEIGLLLAEKGIAFHSDAVAAEGLVPIDVKEKNINLMSLSSNDIYGPRGLGVLYMQKKFRINPIMMGGGQEKGIRSGTEDIPSIVGMATASEIMKKEMSSEIQKFTTWRSKIIDQILGEVPDSHLNGHKSERLASNAHIRFDGIEGESILLSFKDKNIAISTGSACTSKTLEPSHTLISTGLLHEEAHGSLQLTTGRFNTNEDIDAVIEAVPAIVERLRELSPIYASKKGAQ